MKTRTKLLTSIIAVLLSIILLFTFVAVSNNKSNNSQLSANYRTVELSQTMLDEQSLFDKFDSYDIEVNDNTSEFDGFATLSLSDFNDIDCVALSDVAEDVNLKFSSSFDYDTGTATLNVIAVDGEESTIIDTVYGVALLAETGEVDVVFDFDGELVLLSELQNANMLDNVGWFKNLVKKAVSKVVSTVKTTVKVLSTSKGAIGTVCTLAACAAVGALCAFIPGGQIVTATCASIAGSVVGGIGFELTAKAAQTQNSSITDEDISNYKTLGSIAGSAVSVCSCSAVTKWKASKAKNDVKTETKTEEETANETNEYATLSKSDIKKLVKSADKNPTSKTTYIGKYTGDAKSYDAVAKTNNGNYFNLDRYDYYVQKYGEDAMKEVNKQFITTKYKAGNTFYSTTDPSKATNAFKNEIKWLEELGGGTWQQVAENLWKLIR